MLSSEDFRQNKVAHHQHGMIATRLPLEFSLGIHIGYLVES